MNQILLNPTPGIRLPSWNAAVAALVLMAAPATAGPDWDEIGDAGPLPARAQFLFGTGAIQYISGSLATPVLAGDDDDDAQDMFRLVITDPVTIAFSAGTAGAFGGSAAFDTRLWLFDAQGFGLLANDDFGGLQSGFFDASTDGSGILIQTPGVYFIAVSSSESEPIDQFGQPIFLFGSPTEISGPDGLGGGGAIAGWKGREERGSYIIGLSGVEFSPPGDLNGDGIVDGADLALVLAAWGDCEVLGACPADLNFDGTVDAADLGLLLANWT